MNASRITPIATEYTINYVENSIETIVTDKATIVDQWVEDIISLYAGKPGVVGLYVEWSPHEVSYMSNKSATLQLNIDDKCLIVQLFNLDYIPDSLKNFFKNSNFTFLGIDEFDCDIRKLKDEYGLECTKWVDIREVVILRMKKPKHACVYESDILVHGFVALVEVHDKW